MMSNLCIIPARGGSKRIPLKNIKTFLGKPIIAYSIEVAIQSGIFDEVMVSTDDEEITNVAIKYGAKVPFIRSEKNSSDFASTLDVLNEVLNDYRIKKNKEFDSICCIYPTAPLIVKKDMIDGLDLMLSKQLTCVLPIVEFSYPIWRGLEIDSNEKVKIIWPEFTNYRSQDLKKSYHDAGQWYWFDVKKLINWEWPENTGSILISQERVQDIDNISDWKIAEIKYELINKNR
jgi:N-acylneuraminate cytidylyltransferase